MANTTSTENCVRLGGTGRELALVDAVAQSVGFLGPVFSVAFLVPLVVGIISATGEGAGAAAPCRSSAVGGRVLALAGIVAEYAKRIEAAGSPCADVTDGFCSRIGAASGFLYHLGTIGLAAGILVLIGGTIHDVLLAEFGFGKIPTTVWDILLLGLVCLTLNIGVGLSTRVRLVLALFSGAVVLVFCIYVVIRVGSANSISTASSPSSSPDGWGGVFFGVLHGVLMSTGFVTAANPGEETSHPKRDIPRAIITSVVVIGFVHRLVTYAQVAGSRGIFATSRDHRFPSALGKVSGRGTPLRASAVVVVIFAIGILVTGQSIHLFQIYKAPHYFAMFSWLSSYGGFALVVIYLLLSIGATRGLRDHPNKPLHRGAILVSIVARGDLRGLLTVAAPVLGRRRGSRRRRARARVPRPPERLDQVYGTDRGRAGPVTRGRHFPTPLRKELEVRARRQLQQPHGSAPQSFAATESGAHSLDVARLGRAARRSRRSASAMRTPPRNSVTAPCASSFFNDWLTVGRVAPARSARSC